MVILSITGCVLVFEQEIKSLSRPWLHAEQPANAKVLAPSILHRAVEQALPGKHIESVWYHGAGTTANARQAQKVALDSSGHRKLSRTASNWARP